MIEVAGAGKDYILNGRAVTAFDGVDLEVRRGEILSVVGPSGCGKSSLLKAIAGLEPLSRGEIRFEGRRLDGPDPRIGVVFQEARLLPWLTVRENAALAARFAAHRRPGAAGEVDDLLRRVGLEAFGDAYPSQVSGGMAQRAALARTLLQRPTAILFDEPFASLDALRRMELQIWLVRMLKEEGTAALFVTHDLDEALIMGDRIAVMTPRPGRIHRIYDAPPKDRRALEQPGTLAASREFWELKQSILADLRATGGLGEAMADAHVEP